MKPRLFCYMFLWTWRGTTFNNIPSIFIVFTNKKVALIYSVADAVAVTQTGFVDAQTGSIVLTPL